MTAVRALALISLLVALCGCPVGADREQLGATEDDGDNSGSGAGGGAPSVQCWVDDDCIPAGPKCCDCPTHAVPADDPSQRACLDVDCAPQQCGSPLEAACEMGRCVLACAPVACAADISCPTGFATDANGCLTCECMAPTGVSECTADTDCVRTREDCCGCAMGGEDTAVPASQVATFDGSLMCPANPSCPGVDTCAANLEPRCVQGGCALVDGDVPSNACGRAGLAACASGESCYVNANDQATMHGVGVCQP